MGKKERKQENFPNCLFFCSSFVVRKRWRRFRACAVIRAGIGTTTFASGGRICGPVAAGGVGRGASKVFWRKVLFLSLVFRSSRSRSKESAWHYSVRGEDEDRLLLGSVRKEKCRVNFGVDFEDVKNISAVSNRWLPLEMRLGMAVQNLGKGRGRVARFNACVN